MRAWPPLLRWSCAPPALGARERSRAVRSAAATATCSKYGDRRPARLRPIPRQSWHAALGKPRGRGPNRRPAAEEQGAQPAAVTRPQLAQHGAAVRARRAGRHRQARRNGRCREPLQQQHQHVRLAQREPGGRDRVRRREMDELRLTAPPGGESQHEVAAAVRAVRREQHLQAPRRSRPGAAAARRPRARRRRVTAAVRRPMRGLPGGLPAGRRQSGSRSSETNTVAGGRVTPAADPAGLTTPALAGGTTSGANPSAATAGSTRRRTRGSGSSTSASGPEPRPAARASGPPAPLGRMGVGDSAARA